MIDTRVSLSYIEFYITNVCNFNCSGCNRFNNYTFSGSSRWADYKDIYKQWSQRLTFSKATVLGGEPMICSDYKDWLLGIRTLWPESTVILLTNGSQLKDDDKELYDILRSDPQIKLEIGLHNRNRRDQVLNLLYEWLQSPVTISRFPYDIASIPGAEDAWNKSYSCVRDSSWPETCSIHQWQNLPDWIQQECSNVHGFSPEIFLDKVQEFRLQDANGVTVTVAWENFFHQGALIFDQDTGKFRLHNSNVEKAHSNCHSKFCHHMERGKLYKCGQVSLFPQFYEQFHMEINQDDFNLMHGYQPATLDMDRDSLKQWVSGLSDVMPQCRFCPESYQMSEIFAEPKKIKLQKKKSPRS